MARTTNERIVIVLLVGLGLLATLWLRCLWLQVVAARHYTTMARAQQRFTGMLRAQRGAIVDTHGRPLAVSVLAPSVYANARRVSGKAALARQLADAVGRDAAMIQQRLERDKGFVWVARQVDPSVGPVILALRDQPVGVMEEPRRVHPQGAIAEHVLGFTDVDGRGLEGMELMLNGVLAGEDGWRATLRDARGSQLIGPWTTETAPRDGHRVVLTIDSVVQAVAEEILTVGVTQYHAKGGSVIVMDPRSGRVLAMAVEPGFDPDAPGAAPTEARRNRAVTDLFEPGSIFKIIAASALLEEGRITRDDPIFCENGAYHTVGRHILHDHRPHGMLSFADVIMHSSNIGVAKAAQRLTPDELYRYARAFGIGQRTGIDVPGEVNGLLHPPATWSKLSPFIIPIGQEVAVTPIQMAVMMSVIASGGLRAQPYLVERIEDADGGVVRELERSAPVRALTRETAELMQQLLVRVVGSGTGQLANVQGLTVAGKTGTAQKLEPSGRYSHSRFVASFVGFGPVPDPQFVITVSLDEPRPQHFGGVVAAPLFKKIVEQLRGYWELERGPGRLVRAL